MDRLFSKFQLGDIKVGEKSSFPPDAEQEEHQGQAAAAAPAPAESAPLAATEAAAEPTTSVVPVAEGEDRIVSQTAREYRPGYGKGVPENRGEILKVSSRSRPSAVAGAIAGVVRESGRAEVQAIGAGAANQAIKAVAIARDYLNETGIEAICLPSLVDLQIDEADRTAIRLVVETR
ncbi:MAG: Stage V sporulation protein S [uncultured Thermomicrobiales bacterium]|uniref:Stage V sporulation protein S n=1 Tax=uncultured Thermomicrobiales bacterium TaxID=1645740 RepID=A0A6J4VQP1_9BACT|nr:MAG: Stage V sporulation protein S [uncultured Thermomicrobiales bacterium]